MRLPIACAFLLLTSVTPAQTPSPDPSIAPFARLKAHKGRVVGLVFSSDNRFLLTVGRDRTMRIWDIASGKAKQTIDISGSKKDREDLTLLNNVLWSHDTRYVVLSGTREAAKISGFVQVWDTQQNKLAWSTRTPGSNAWVELGGKDAPLTQVFVSTKAKSVTFRSIDLASGRVITEKKVERPDAKKQVRITLDPTGQSAAIGNKAQGGIEIWDTRRGERRHIMKIESKGKRGVRFSSDGKRVYVVDTNHRVHVFTAATGKAIRTFGDTGHEMRWVMPSPDSTFLIAGSSLGTHLLAAAGTLHRGVDIQMAKVMNSWKQIAISPDSRTIAVIGGRKGKAAIPVGASKAADEGGVVTVWKVSDIVNSRSIISARRPKLESEAISKLVQQLGHDEFAKREEAHETLQKLGEAARAALTKALDSTDAEVQDRAERLLELIGAELRPLPPEREKNLRSQASVVGVTLTLVNESDRTVRFFWIDFNGKRDARPVLKPGQSYVVSKTYQSHAWVVTNEKHQALAVFIVGNRNARVTINNDLAHGRRWKD